MNTTLTYALDDILTYKNAIKTSINNKGGNVGDTLSYYASAIDNLPTASARYVWPEGLKCTNSSPYVDWSEVDTSNVENMSEFFASSSFQNMSNLSYFDSSSATNMYAMFANNNDNTEEYDANTGELVSSYLNFDFSYLDTSNVTNMNNMFSSCSATYFDLSHFNTYNVTNMTGMFASSGLKTLDLSSFNTYNVTSMAEMFSGCTSLTSLDLSYIDTTNVTDMSNMFNSCQNFTSLDLSSFNTYNVTNMNGMFYGCNKITSLDLSSFNTYNVTTFEDMFAGLHSVSSLDLSYLDLTNAMSLNYMFCNTETPTTLNLSNWNFETNDNYCSISGLFQIDEWSVYDENTGTETSYSWRDVNRTIILDNVSNDVFNYLTQYTDSDWNDPSQIAPNWVIHRDGDVYEYDDNNSEWSVTGQVPTPQPEPTISFTSPVDGDTITATEGHDEPGYNQEIEMTGVTLDDMVTFLSVDNNANQAGCSIVSISEDIGNGYEETTHVFVNLPCGTGQCTLTYDDGENDPVSVTFDYDISQYAPQSITMTLESDNWTYNTSDDEPNQYQVTVVDDNGNDVTAECTFYTDADDMFGDDSSDPGSYNYTSQGINVTTDGNDNYYLSWTGCVMGGVNLGTLTARYVYTDGNGAENAMTDSTTFSMDCTGFTQ